MDSSSTFPAISTSTTTSGQLPSSSSPSTPVPHTISTGDTLQLVALFVVGIVSTAANLLVILTVLPTRKLRTTSSSLLVTNLALADLALTSVTVPLAACGVMNDRWVFSQAACSVTATVSGVFSAASALSVAAIAVDRYLAILHCLRYSVWPRWRYLLLVLTCTWVPALVSGVILSTRVTVVSYLPAHYLCAVVAARSPAYEWTRAFVVFLAPVAVLLFAYARVIYVARLHSRRIDVEAPRSRKSHSDGSRRAECVSPNGAVAAGALFSIRRLSILSLPLREEEGGRQIRISGDVELISTSAHVIRGEVSHHRYHRRSCASLKLVLLVFMFVLCYGVRTVLSLYQTTVHSPHREEVGILVTEIADTTGSEYILSPPVETINEADDEKNASTDQTQQSLMRTGFWLMVLNSMLNPFLYAISSQRFRFFASRLFSKQDGSAGGEGPHGGHLFDVSIYSAFLRNLQTPVASRRSSADSCEVSQQHFPLTAMVSANDRRDSGSSIGTASTLVESKAGSPVPRHTHISRSRYLEVPHALSGEDVLNTPDNDPRDRVELRGGGDVLFRRKPSVSSATSVCSDCSSSFSDSQASTHRTSRKNSEPVSLAMDDDYVFSANNAARIRIVLDLV